MQDTSNNLANRIKSVFEYRRLNSIPSWFSRDSGSGIWIQKWLIDLSRWSSTDHLTPEHVKISRPCCSVDSSDDCSVDRLIVPLILIGWSNPEDRLFNSNSACSSILRTQNRFNQTKSIELIQNRFINPIAWSSAWYVPGVFLGYSWRIPADNSTQPMLATVQPAKGWSDCSSAFGDCDRSKSRLIEARISLSGCNACRCVPQAS